MYNQLGICELFIIVTLNMYITHLSFQTKKKKCGRANVREKSVRKYSVALKTLRSILES